MLDAREYDTTESLKAAMISEARAEIKSILKSKYDSIKSDQIRIGMCTGYDMFGAMYGLDRNDIYRYANEIEESARRMAKTASEIKALCRIIPTENENDE